MGGTEALIASAVLGTMQTVHGMSSAASQRRAQAAKIAQQQEHAALQQRLKERQLNRQHKSQKATARARLGASGISSAEGSGGAVIRGLSDDFNQQISDSRTLFNSSMAGTNLLDDGDQFGDALRLGQQLIGLGQSVVGALEEKPVLTDVEATISPGANQIKKAAFKSGAGRSNPFSIL